MIWVWSPGSSIKSEAVKTEVLTFQVSRFNHIQTRKEPFLGDKDFSRRYHLLFGATRLARRVLRKESHLLFILHLSLSSALTAELLSLDNLLTIRQRPGHVLTKQDMVVLYGQYDSAISPLQVHCGCLK